MISLTGFSGCCTFCFCVQLNGKKQSRKSTNDCFTAEAICATLRLG